ncbi:hypothetical protein GCM10012275_54490 [Longimycelium tulufanense]|uniref:Tail terminator n=1 Tax=Longimycelium tulufanense TaxID=907463 RepID=A0A8J3CD89_9PSEU|nr:minor capsid protein [Longimycelium tulufanense]GGM76902.1 hypothetical protein GCM10012275_54490 [Longimycelium tulufanense]
MTLSEEFAYLLAQLGLGEYRVDGSVGGNIYLAALPQSPDVALAVALYGGSESDSKLGYDEPRVQVRVRGTTDPRIGEQRAQDVYDALHGLAERWLAGGTLLLSCIGVQAGPIPMGRDGNGRFEYSVNFRAELRRPTINRV